MRIGCRVSGIRDWKRLALATLDEDLQKAAGVAGIDYSKRVKSSSSLTTTSPRLLRATGYFCPEAKGRAGTEKNSRNFFLSLTMLAGRFSSNSLANCSKALPNSESELIQVPAAIA